MTGFLRHLFFHNFALKLMSVLLAAGLWFMISRDEEPAEVAVRALIVFENVPPDLDVSSESIPEAQIRVRGPERIIRQLKTNDVQAEVDLSGVKPQDRTFDLTAQQVRHPREITVLQIVPSRLHMAFDTHLTREVEIHPRVTGNLPSGEQIVKVQADPSRITIAGPSHHVEKVEAATTDLIDATGTLGTGVFTTNVYVADPLVQIEQTTSIRVTVVVQKVGIATTH